MFGSNSRQVLSRSPSHYLLSSHSGQHGVRAASFAAWGPSHASNDEGLNFLPAAHLQNVVSFIRFISPKMFANVVFHLNPSFPVFAPQQQQQQLHTFGFTLGDLSWHTEVTVLAEWCKRATIFVKTKFNKNEQKCKLTVTSVSWFRNPSLFLGVSPFPSLSKLLYLLQGPYHGHGQTQKLNARMTQISEFDANFNHYLPNKSGIDQNLQKF